MKEAEFHLNEERGTVRLTVTERYAWGAIQRRTQHTFKRRQFERALLKAKITAPWTTLHARKD